MQVHSLTTNLSKKVEEMEESRDDHEGTDNGARPTGGKPIQENAGEDRIMKLLFEVEKEIMQSQMLRKEHISLSCPLELQNPKGVKPKTDFVNPMEKIQQAKMDTLANQIEHYKGLYLASSVELKSLKNSIRDNEAEITDAKQMCQTLEEQLENKANTIRSLECQLNTQKNQFDNQRRKLEHQSISRGSVGSRQCAEGSAPDGDTGLNGGLREECENLRAEKERLKGKMSKLAKRGESSKAESEKLKEECEELREKVARMTNQQSQEECERDLAHQKFGKANERLQGMERELKELRKFYEEMNVVWGKEGGKEERGLGEWAEVLGHQMEQQRNDMESLKRQLDRVSKSEETRSLMDEKASQELKEAIRQLGSELSEKKNENLKRLGDSLRGVEEIRFIQQQMNHFEAEINEKRLMNKVMREKIKSVEVASDPDENREIQMRLEECQTMLHQIQDTAALSLSAALDTTLKMKHQLDDMGRTAGNSRCLQLDRGERWHGGEGGYMSHIRAIEERSIRWGRPICRLGEILAEIRNDI